MAEEIKRHNIVFNLDLNKHPKDATNLSLINAENFKVSEDGANLISDKSLLENNTIRQSLNYYYQYQSGIDKYKIVHVISTNDEIVLFVENTSFVIKNNKKIPIGNIEANDTNYIKLLTIFRYNELLDSCKCIRLNNDTLNGNVLARGDDMKYYGGKFSGTFTYNVKNELIIAFCEYDSVLPTEFDCGEPMKIINLGYWDKDDNNNNILINNSNLNPKTFPICPEVSIPQITNWSIEKGLSKKGWYHFYIRYKINKYDYTQWFNFGRAFYLDDIIEQTIFDYPVIKDKTVDSTTESEDNWTLKVKCSDESDICNKTISFDLLNLCELYENYQIAFINNTKIYNECKITNDINIKNNKFLLNYANCTNYDETELLKVNNNYYNVKNIINYNNRLYITNYKENKQTKNAVNNISYKVTPINVGKSSEYISIIYNNKKKVIKLNNNTIKAKDLYGVTSLYSYSEKTDNELSSTGITAGDDWNNLKNKINYVINNNDDTYRSGNGNFRQAYRVSGCRANGKWLSYDVTNSTLRWSQFSEDVYGEYWVKRIYLAYNEYTNIKDISDYDFEYDTVNNILVCNKLSDNTKVIGINSILFIENASNELKFSSDFVEYDDIMNNYIVIKEATSDHELNYQFTLIPNQVYSFYIHYIDKYGQITEGVPINNLIFEDVREVNVYNYFTRNDKKYICFAHNIYEDNDDLVTLNIKILIDVNDVLPEFNKVDFDISYTMYDSEEERYKLNKNTTLFYISTLDKGTTGIGFYTYEELTSIYCSYRGAIYTISELLKHSPSEYEYITKIDNELLYSRPISEIGVLLILFGRYNYYLLNKFIYHNGNAVIFTLDEFVSITFNNIIIPDKYVSYFISYEKLDKNLIWSGHSISGNENVLYSDSLNYKESVSLNIDFDNDRKLIKSVKYNVANSFKDNNYGKSTNLKITYKEDLERLPNYLYKYPLNVYNNSNKILIRVSEISNNSSIDVRTYGFYTYNNVIIANKAYRINSANILLDALSLDKLNENPFYPISDELRFQYIPDCSKQINNPPKIYKTIINEVEYENPKAEFYDSYLFLPQDTIDLFKNNALDYDESVLSIYTNYNEDNVNKTDFEKTIRRSTYIKDESLENGWRTFETEAYQNIQENKGPITRIEGIGDLLLVHTKDSLFQFDKSNLLVAENKTVQLGQQDTFDVGYKEIFTSTYGYGGLQDKDAAIIGEFGYIYYNNDFNKLYQYDAGKLNVISGNIEFLLNRFKPTKCKFVDDKQNKRLLIQFQLNNNKVLNLTYNYDIKAFISFYINEDSDENVFNEVYNTKTKFYILENNKIFSGFDKPNAKKLSFIINEQYSKIKRLNYIKYKLYKKEVDTNEFNANSPVEGYAGMLPISNTLNHRPYSGYKLRVYNDLCDTGELDISVDLKSKDNTDINKPYYDLGNFTFNYLRDKDSKNQIFGNFFIVEFTFNQTDNDIIEFESLEYDIDYEEN